MRTLVQVSEPERQAARKSNDFKRADEVRAQLAQQGWVIEDTHHGARAKRTGWKK